MCVKISVYMCVNIHVNMCVNMCVDVNPSEQTDLVSLKMLAPKVVATSYAASTIPLLVVISIIGGCCICVVCALFLRK